MRMRRIKPHEHDLGVSLNTHEEVVEVMRNTTGQGPYGLHFLSLKELIL